MAESSAERRRLLTQAVRGFAQRHPDSTMASVEIHLAHAVGLSVASVQRWRASYPIAERHIPALAEWAVRQAGMDRCWLHSFLRHCAFTDPGLEERLFGSSIAPSASTLRRTCQAANTRMWGNERLASAAAVHLARAGPLQLIRSFLCSDRPGLILVGASGLGKTSLALWLADERAELDRPVLVYPAALLDGACTLSQMLHDTLQPHLDQSPPSDASPLAWPILVVFDGVNESPEMRRLAWQIDRGLVEAQGLKVMLTFRPESFQIVRHSLTLSEHCYFDPGAGVEPWPGLSGLVFDPPAVHLLPFTPAESEPAYLLYRQTHALQTPYTDLPAPLRQALRHPLTLRLLAETYSGARLPQQVDTDQLVELLLEALVAHGRLERADLCFLQDELLPMMIAPGRWSNLIPAGQMAAARTPGGRRLIRPGEPGPFTRLADAGILTTTSERLSESLRFAHERFFEHLAYGRLRQLRASATDAQGFYSTLAGAPPFLYGPARRLLAEEIARQPVEWWMGLMRGSSQALRDFLLIGALEEWGRSHPDQVHARLERLWTSGQPRQACLLNRFGLPAPEPAAASAQIQRIAVSAAGALSDEALLIRALLTGSPSMQQAAVTRVLHVWQTDPQAGQRILTEIERGVTGRLGLPIGGPVGLPRWSAALAFLQLAGLILCEFGQQAEVKAVLSAEIQAAVRRVFGPPWRRLLLRLVINWLVGLWEREMVIAIGLDSTLDSTFQLPAEQRRHLEALAPLIDWETPGLSAAYEHVRAALETGGLVAGWFLLIPLVVRGRLGQPEVWALILRLLREACETHPPRAWAIILHWIATDIMRTQPCTDPELWAAVDRNLSAMMGSYPGWHEAYRSSRLKPPHRLIGPAQGWCGYVVARDIARLPIEEGPVWAVVAERLAAGDVSFILDYLGEVRSVVWDHRRPRLALRLIRPVLACPDESVRHTLTDLLAWIKTMAAEDVHELLASGVVPPELAASVQAWQFADRLIERHVFGVWNLIFRLLIESRPARQMLSHIFAQVTRFSSMRAWMSWAAQLVLNALAGQALFPARLPDL